ncbi:MAG: GGDEF domain-containing protein [Spirochaetales bacterium]|nr:GGDEF domain-containing protein [Spirochaetales bacterium]
MNIVKKRYITGYAIFSLFFFLALFAFILLSIQNMTITNREAAEKHFMEIRNNIVLSFSYSGDFSSDTMENVFSVSLAYETRLVALVIYSHNLGPLKAKAKDSYYLKDFNSKLHTKPFTLEYNRPPGTWVTELPITLKYSNIEIDAFISGLYVVLGSKDYTALLWYVLYILSGFLVITIIVMIVISTRGKVEGRQSFPTPSLNTRRGHAPKQQVKIKLPRSPETDFTFDQEPAPAREDTRYAREDVLAQAVSPEQEAAVFGQGAGDQFSPSTGLGSSENLMNRLQFELERATSFGQDIAVAFLKLQENENETNPLHYKELAGLILSYFPFQDLAFEYAPKAFVVIIPDQTVEQALQNINALHSGARDRDINVGIGISSRDNRIITAEALISEAKASLKKALIQGRNQIVIFQADPDNHDEIFSEET